ncbi:MAG: hypothetical protein PHS48_03800 [Bacteroidales bacterium]|nr:hypothetical protein [Bacteroidales bacterium]
MNKEVKERLKDFYEGKTSLKEEHLLKDMLSREPDDELLSDQALFEALYDHTEEIPKEVSDRLAASLKQYQETSACRETPLYSLQSDAGNSQRSKKLIYWISSIAAVGLLGIGLFFATNHHAEPTPPYAVTDPEEAAVIAGEALRQVSLNLNKGIAQMQAVQQDVQRSDQILKSSLKF